MSKKVVFEWVVLEGIAHKAILGADFLEKMKATLDYPSQTVTLDNCPQPFLYQECSAVSEVSHTDPLQLLLTDYDDLFFVKGSKLKECKLRPLTIDTGSSPPVFQHPYRTPLSKRKAIEAELDSLLKMGIIRPSSSSYSAPLLMVPKKDGSQRMCIDYRRLNLVTKMDRHPLPLIQDIFDQLGEQQFFQP